MAAIATTDATDIDAEAKKLRHHFKFTQDDLELNRRGQLSDKQKQRIAEEERGGRKLGIGIGAFLMVFGVAFIPMAFNTAGALNNPTFRREATAYAMMLGTAVLLGLLSLALLGGGVFLIVSQFLKARAGGLASVTGRARLESVTSERRSRSSYYDLYIGEHEFDSDGSFEKVITTGAQYTVYYIEGVDEIVSIERAS